METKLRDTQPSDKREHPRARLWMPVLIRRSFGEAEIAQSHNVSRGGIRFVSKSRYYVGDLVKVACPYNEAGPNLELEARIVSRREIKGGAEWTYGVSYLRTPTGRN